MERTSTRMQAAYEAIKDRIITLEMPPGHAFSELEMARLLTVSKTPIREALVQLQREGLVEVTARSGYRVALVTLKDIRDLYALRMVLDSEAAALAALRLEDSESMRILERLCHISYDPEDSLSTKRFLRTNTEFHSRIALIGGNERLAAVLHQVLEQMERFFHLAAGTDSRAEESVKEHEVLLKAIMAGDCQRARDLAVAQCRASQASVTNALLSSPAVLEANLWGSAPNRRVTPKRAAEKGHTKPELGNGNDKRLSEATGVKPRTPIAVPQNGGKSRRPTPA